MTNKILNLIKLKENVDNNSINFFYAALKHNAKSQPIVKSELVKWPFYNEYWEHLLKNNLVTPFEIKTTTDNIAISGDFIKSPVKNANNQKVVFILHGVTNTRYWIFKQAYVFLKAGYNLVWYDARNHGQSEICQTTLGKKESHDLQDIINYIAKTYPQYNDFLLYGFSLGAITIILWGYYLNKFEVNQKVKLLICDSGYSHWEENYDEKVNEKKYLVFDSVNKFVKSQIRKILDLKELDNINPIKFIRYFNDLPILFLHGKNDTFISYVNSQELYKEKTSYESPIKSELYLVEKANHGQTFLVGDNGVAIYDHYNQKMNKKISTLILEYIEKTLNN